MADYLQHRNHPFLKFRIKPVSWSGEEWNFAEMKEDGHRIALINNEGKMEAYGRKHENIWSRIASTVKGTEIPNNTMIEGEYLSFVGSEPYFRAFSLPVLNGTPPWSLQYAEARGLLGDMGFKVVEQISIPTTSTQEEMEALVKTRKAEGLVLKLGALSGWYKMKPVLTADCVVTDYFYGEGKYQGMMGALEASVYDNGNLIPIAHVGGGWKDSDRELEREDVIDRVMEVKYDCILKDRLRFPRFMRWRDDKPANECLYPEKGR